MDTWVRRFIAEDEVTFMTNLIKYNVLEILKI